MLPVIPVVACFGIHEQIDLKFTPHRVSFLTKMISKTFLLFILMVLSTTEAFYSPLVFGVKQRLFRSVVNAVIDIGSEAAFDKTIKNSGSALVVVDYSTTWCGPCKGVLRRIDLL